MPNVSLPDVEGPWQNLVMAMKNQQEQSAQELEFQLGGAQFVRECVSNWVGVAGDKKWLANHAIFQIVQDCVSKRRNAE